MAHIGLLSVAGLLLRPDLTRDMRGLEFLLGTHPKGQD